MKKQLLLLVMILLPMVAMAQSVFNEDDLTGKWLISSKQHGEPLGVYEITFWDYANIHGYYGKMSQNYGDIIDFCISPSNRLYINFNTKCLIFKIISITSDEMVLSYRREDYNHNIQTYEYKFHREGASAINEITDEMTDFDNIYNLKGQLLENESDSGVYIQNGKKYIKK